MLPQLSPTQIIFASFPIRGPMQPNKLICEYLNIPYQNKYFDPCTWCDYLKKNKDNLLYHTLPYFQCGNLTLTNAFAAGQYILQKNGFSEMLGTNDKEKLIVNSSSNFQSNLISLLQLQCKYKDKPKQVQQDARVQFWNEKIGPKMKKMDKIVDGDWVFKKISIVDFFIYEFYRNWADLYPQMKEIKNLFRVAQNVGNLPVVKAYEQSDKAPKQTCPNTYFKQFELKYKQSCKTPCQSEKKKSCFTFCSEKEQNKKSGFCRYQSERKNDMDVE